MTTRRLLEVEYHPGEEVVVRLRPRLLPGVPRDALRHWRKANRELLLAIRGLLDGAIERMESDDSEEGRRRGSRRKRVEVTEEESP